MSKKAWFFGGSLIVLLLLAVGVWFFFLRDDAPDEVSIDAANDQLDADLAEAEPENGPESTPDSTPESESTPDPATESDETGESDGIDPESDETAPDPGGIDGTWVVNDEIGEFDFDSASGSFAGFRVAEELDVVGDTTAVGRSGDVTGTVTIESSTLTSADVTVDMTSIVSDRQQRESAIQRAINTGEFPTARFTFSDEVDVSAIEVGGTPQAFEVSGELTINGVTRPTTFDIEANVRDDGFGIITGSTEIVWNDFDVAPPSAPIVVSVADEGTVEFQLVVERS